jgi:hypothetical protein
MSNCVCHETSSRNCPVHQNEGKPREWLIDWCDVTKFRYLYLPEEIDLGKENYIRVIEHSAFAALQKENADLKALAIEMRDALEKTGCVGHRAKREECTCHRCVMLTKAEKVIK